MKNLIRMNFYRLLHTRSTWVITICMVALMTLITVSNYYSMKKYSSEGLVVTIGTTDETSTSDASSEGTSTSDASSNEESALEGQTIVTESATIFDEFCSGLGGADYLIFIIIFAVIFIHGEDKNGFIKNISHATKHRFDTYFAKLCMAILLLVVYILFNFILNLIIGKIYFPNMAIGSTAGTVKYFLLVVLAYIAFVTVISTVTVVARSSAAGLTLGLLGCLGFGMVIVSILNFITRDIIDFTHYFIVTGMFELSQISTADEMIRAGIVFAVWLIIGLGVGAYVSERRDVV